MHNEWCNSKGEGEKEFVSFHSSKWNVNHCVHFSNNRLIVVTWKRKKRQNVATIQLKERSLIKMSVGNELLYWNNAYNHCLSKLIAGSYSINLHQITRLHQWCNGSAKRNHACSIQSAHKHALTKTKVQNLPCVNKNHSIKVCLFAVRKRSSELKQPKLSSNGLERNTNPGKHWRASAQWFALVLRQTQLHEAIRFETSSLACASCVVVVNAFSLGGLCYGNGLRWLQCPACASVLGQVHAWCMGIRLANLANATACALSHSTSYHSCGQAQVTRYDVLTSKKMVNLESK